MNGGAGKPPLSYSIPSFSQNGLDDCATVLQRLRGLGFRHVTFTPTFQVLADAPLNIDLGRTPDCAVIDAAVVLAHDMGFGVRMEPHLDYASTFSSGPYRWRRDLVFDPSHESTGYFDKVIIPQAAALAPGDELTLGSELDLSLTVFPHGWERMRTMGPQVLRRGHKINHDFFDGRVPDAVFDYLRALEYVSFSFYPRIGWRRGWTPNDIAAAFRRKAERLVEMLRARIAPSSTMTIGEFGLGSTDLNSPWKVAPETLTGPEPFQARRDYYLGFLQFCAASADLLGGNPVTFWTVGHFDFLGVLGFSSSPLFKDDSLIRAVIEYNSQGVEVT